MAANCRGCAAKDAEIERLVEHVNDLRQDLKEAMQAARAPAGGFEQLGAEVAADAESDAAPPPNAVGTSSAMADAFARVHGGMDLSELGSQFETTIADLEKVYAGGRERQEGAENSGE